MPAIDIKAAAEVLATLELAVIGLLWGLYQKALADIRSAQEREIKRGETVTINCRECMTKFMTQNTELAKATVIGLEQNTAALIALKNDLHLYETINKLGRKGAS